MVEDDSPMHVSKAGSLETCAGDHVLMEFRLWVRVRPVICSALNRFFFISKLPLLRLGFAERLTFHLAQK